MKLNIFTAIITLTLAGVLTTACDDSKGKSEAVVKKVENTAEHAKDATKEAAKDAAEKVEETAGKVVEKTEEVMKEGANELNPAPSAEESNAKIEAEAKKVEEAAAAATKGAEKAE